MGAQASKKEESSLSSRKESSSSSSSSPVDSTSQVYTYQTSDWPWVWSLRDCCVLDWKAGLTNEDILVQAKRHEHLPVEVLPDLIYLGNTQCVRNVTKLKEELGITRVLNMAGPLALPKQTIQAFKQHGILYKRITAQDEEGYPLLQKHWNEAYDFILATKEAGEKCVVHCVAGHNRSVLIVAAAYMIQTQTNVMDTMRHVRRQRGNVALSNESFQEQLVAMARLQNLLGQQPPCTVLPPLPLPLQGQPRHPPKAHPLDRLAAG